MTSLPRFSFPFQSDSDSTKTVTNKSAERGRQRRLHISPPSHSMKEARSREGRSYTLSVPGQSQRTPGVITTPPASPNRSRSYTMGANRSFNIPKSHDDCMTPPPTPTNPSQSKSDSSCSIRSSLDGLRRGDSISFGTKLGRAPSIDASERPGSAEPRQFEFWLSDYEIKVDQHGNKTALGSGAWSKVYHGIPCLSNPQEVSIVPDSEMTPPVTPIRSRNSSLSKGLSYVSSAYAVKIPDSQSARRVMTEECRILSYLSRFPGSENFVVPFHGQDARNDALVLKLMDSSMDDWIKTDLNTLSEPDRAARLTRIFPSIASHLLEGLAWLEEKNCVHGDIKPANILLSSTSSSSTPHSVFTDFSASTLLSIPRPSTLDTTSKAKGPFGGATWDFLDPLLTTKSHASTFPSATTDLWSLAMTLLLLVIGQSPYSRVAANEYQKREFIRQGDPLGCMGLGENGLRNTARMNALSKSLGFDVTAWFKKVLTRNIASRVEIEAWGEELKQLIVTGTMRH